MFKNPEQKPERTPLEKTPPEKTPLEKLFDAAKIEQKDFDSLEKAQPKKHKILVEYATNFAELLDFEFVGYEELITLSPEKLILLGKNSTKPSSGVQCKDGIYNFISLLWDQKLLIIAGLWKLSPENLSIALSNSFNVNILLSCYSLDDIFSLSTTSLNALLEKIDGYPCLRGKEFPRIVEKLNINITQLYSLLVKKLSEDQVLFLYSHAYINSLENIKKIMRILNISLLEKLLSYGLDKVKILMIYSQNLAEVVEKNPKYSSAEALLTLNETALVWQLEHPGGTQPRILIGTPIEAGSDPLSTLQPAQLAPAAVLPPAPAPERAKQKPVAISSQATAQPMRHFKPQSQQPPKREEKHPSIAVALVDFTTQKHPNP